MHAGGQLIEDNFSGIKKRGERNNSEMNLFLGNEIMACNDMAQMLSSVNYSHWLRQIMFW